MVRTKQFYGARLAVLRVLMFALMCSLVPVSNGFAGAGTSGGFRQRVNLTNREVAEVTRLNDLQQQFLHDVEARMASLHHDRVFRQRIEEYSAGEKMALFLQAVRKAERMNKDLTKVLRSSTSDALNAVSGGEISGTVTLEGGPLLFDAVEVLAFDRFGFFAASTLVNLSTGTYTISGLPSGNYYVVTRSTYVDEFYNDVPLANFENWRSATLITATDNNTVSGIDFDLRKGARLSGTVTEEGTGAPLSFEFFTLRLTDINDSDIDFEIDVVTDAAGAYEVTVPELGSFIIQANDFGFEPEYYNNKASRDMADPVVISSFDDNITGIDFSLMPQSSASSSGRIRGVVMGPGDMPVPFAFVFAFNLADTSVAGLGIAEFNGEYAVPGLQDGQYVVYADQLLDILIPPPLEGEYFDNAKTSDQATVLTLAAGDTLADINFSLETGGGIAGTIAGDDGVKLDSVLIVAVKLDVANVGNFFTDDIDFGVAISDTNGNYALSGLSSGDYKVRTVSALGKHSGIYLDEYYQDVHGLFDVAQAMPVSVTSPDTTTGIDFVLTTGAMITGNFYEVGTTTPVLGVGTVVPIDGDSGVPVLASTTYDSLTGGYELGPLPSGNFKLLGFVTNQAPGAGLGLNGVEDRVIYLPQFYDGKSSLDEADFVITTAPNTTTGIDFSMVRAATVEGVVEVAPNVRAGADSLADMVVLAFDATSGKLLASSDLTFAGGYRITGLPPVGVKVAALPFSDGFAATYVGGGTAFGDANSNVITLAAGTTTPTGIQLANGAGQITGTVYNADGTIPLDGILVLAYDQTGHAVSAGISGFGAGFLPGEPGRYMVSGLRSGSYFLRTFTLFQLFDLISTPGSSGNSLDPFALLFGLLDSSDPAGSFDLQLYGDLWYDGQAVMADPGRLDVLSLLLGLLSSNSGDPQVLLPLFDMVPGGATAVNVSSPGLTDGIDFRLSTVQNPLTGVADDRGAVVAERFVLAQNYPNPFNPGTVVRYDVPEQAHVKLDVFNMLGQHIRTLVDEVQRAGSYTSQWDGTAQSGRQVAAGIYFLKLRSGDVTLTRKMLLVK